MIQQKEGEKETRRIRGSENQGQPAGLALLVSFTPCLAAWQAPTARCEWPAEEPCPLGEFLAKLLHGVVRA